MKRFTLVELAVLCAIVATIIGTVLGQNTKGTGGIGIPKVNLFNGYSTGTRGGQLIKISKKGLFWKTWEGQLQLGGDGQASLNLFSFSVTSDELGKELDKNMNKKMVLHYTQSLIFDLTKQGTAYDITSYTLSIKERGVEQ